MSNKAVVNGTLIHISPSQVTTYTSCNRAWYADKILGLRAPETKSQNLGTAVHSQLEEFYTNGTLPEHASARVLIEHPTLPRPGDALLVETPRDYQLGIKAAGVTVKGRIDLVDKRNPERTGIVDFKTTSNLKYAKTPDELARNVQLVTYAEYIFSQPDAPKEVVLTHAYVLTTGTNAKVVSSDTLTRDDVAPIYAAISETVESMKITAAVPDFELVEPNYSHCDAYGGCPYADRCGVTLSPWNRKRTPATSTATPGGFDYSFPSSTPVPVTEGSPSMSITEKLASRRATGINPPDAAKHPAAPEKVQVVEALIAAAPTFTATGLGTPTNFKEALEALESEISTTATPAPVAAVPSSSGATGELVLYVGCRPTKGVDRIGSLDEEIARRSQPILAHWSKQTGRELLDVREIDFGKGTAELFASFRRTPLVGAWAANGDGLGAGVVEVLTPLATVVVRGGR